MDNTRLQETEPKQPPSGRKNFRSGLKDIAMGLVLTLVIFIVGLASLELLVRKIKPQITLSEATKRSDSVWQTSPYVPFTFKPNARQEGGLIINSLGYKGDEFAIKKPAGVYRILVLGDSFVAGIDHDNHLSWPSMMQKMFRDSGFTSFEVINAGFHDGYSPDTFYAYLVGEGLALNPDLVVEGVYLQNDLSDIHSNIWNKIDDKGLPLKVTSSWRKLDAFGREVSDIPPFRYRYPLLGESHLWILLTNWIEGRFPSLVHSPEEAKRHQEDQNYFGATFSSCIYVSNCFTQYFDKDFERMEKVLGGTAQLLAAHQIPLLIVWQPSIWQLKLHLDMDFPPDGAYYLQNMVVDYFKTKNLAADFYDLTPEYQKIDARKYYYPKPETHWNPNGNRYTAQLVFNKIRSIIGR